MTAQAITANPRYLLVGLLATLRGTFAEAIAATLIDLECDRVLRFHAHTMAARSPSAGYQFKASKPPRTTISSTFWWTSSYAKALQRYSKAEIERKAEIVFDAIAGSREAQIELQDQIDPVGWIMAYPTEYPQSSPGDCFTRL